MRGKVIPVIDLRLKFSMPEVEYTQKMCIIVVDVDSVQAGIIVDSVSEVMDIKRDEIEATTNIGQGIDTNFINRLSEKNGKIIILLNIEKVLSFEELEMVEQLA